MGDGDKRANIQLEPNVKVTHKQIDSLDDNFEITKDGYPMVVLEAITLFLE